MNASPHIPPSDTEAETTVLSEILNAPETFRLCVEGGLQPEHFYVPAHSELFRAMRHVAANGSPLDELTVWTAAQSLGLANKIERESLAAVAAHSSGRSNPEGVSLHVRRIIEQANKRGDEDGAMRVLESVREKDPERSAELRQAGLELIAADHSLDAEPTSREQLAEDFFTYLDEEEAAEVFKLPFEELNECVLGGYRRKQTSVLAGWTGSGKSWWLDQVLTGFAEQGHSTAIFATEMSKRERVARFITQETGIPTERLLLKSLSKDQMAEAVQALNKIPFDYYECNGWSADEICQRIVLGGYDVAAIDVINLIPRYEERTEHASRIVGQFMALAQRADCHIILVSHLNRERDKDKKKPRPVKRDLRQTGMLEANAHAIQFVHREQDDEGNNIDSGEIFFAKVRNGVEGSVNVVHNIKNLKFDREAGSSWNGGLSFDDDRRIAEEGLGSVASLGGRRS